MDYPVLNTVNLIHQIDDDVLKKDPANSIIFFDIDNTLFRTKTDIGSDEWVKWQEKLFDEHNGNHPHLVVKTKNEIYEHYRKWLLVSDCDTELLEDVIIDLINKYIVMGYKIVLITAREKCLHNLTIKQLKKYYDTDLFYPKNLQFESEGKLFTSGIYFTGGMNKGKCIRYLLEVFKTIYKFNPNDIFFIDDSLKECHNVQKEFNGDAKNKNIIIFCYTHSIKYHTNFHELDKDFLTEKWLNFIKYTSLS